MEEALIDLMNSLESLVGDQPEIRYRMSLRTATLLSIKDTKMRSLLFTQVYNLGNKRNRIVHGRETKLDYNEVFDFSKIVQKNINLAKFQQEKT